VLFSSPIEITSLRLNRAGDRFVFSQKAGGESNTNEEIFTLSIDGNDLLRITQNSIWDLYPCAGYIAYPQGRNDYLAFFLVFPANLQVASQQAIESKTREHSRAVISRYFEPQPITNKPSTEGSDWRLQYLDTHPVILGEVRVLAQCINNDTLLVWITC